MARATITISGGFHGARARTFRLSLEPRAVGSYWLSPRQRKEARKHLCGCSDCTCRAFGRGEKMDLAGLPAPDAGCRWYIDTCAMLSDGTYYVSVFQGEEGM